MKKRSLLFTILFVVAAYVFTIYYGLNDAGYQAYIAQKEYNNSVLADNESHDNAESNLVLKIIYGVYKAVTMIDPVVK